MKNAFKHLIFAKTWFFLLITKEKFTECRGRGVGMDVGEKPENISLKWYSKEIKSVLVKFTLYYYKCH